MPEAKLQPWMTLYLQTDAWKMASAHLHAACRPMHGHVELLNMTANSISSYVTIAVICTACMHTSRPTQGLLTQHVLRAHWVLEEDDTRHDDHHSFDTVAYRVRHGAHSLKDKVAHLAGWNQQQVERVTRHLELSWTSRMNAR